MIWKSNTVSPILIHFWTFWNEVERANLFTFELLLFLKFWDGFFFLAKYVYTDYTFLTDRPTQNCQTAEEEHLYEDWRRTIVDLQGHWTSASAGHVGTIWKGYEKPLYTVGTSEQKWQWTVPMQS